MLTHKMLLVAARFAALLVCMGMHWVLAWAASSLLPEEWRRAEKLLEVILLGGFALLYLNHVIEMVAVFVPRIADLRRRMTGEDNEP